MAVTKLSQIVKLNGSFRNSINLYLNLNKKEKIDSYIPTKSSLNILKRYVGSVIKNKDHSTILIGSYGKGKSHLLLILLAIVSMQRTKENNEIVKSLLKKIRMVDEETFEIVSSVWNKKGRFLPVIISGSIDDVSRSFMIALNDALKRENLMNLMPDTFFSIAEDTICRWKKEYPEVYINYEKALKKNGVSINDIKNGLKVCDPKALEVFKSVYPSLMGGEQFNPLTGSEVLPMYQSVADKLREQYGYSGIYLVFDEFSKFIEGQEKHSIGGNMKFLQDMCELANESKDTQIYMTMVAHKSIKEYGAYLSEAVINAFTGIEGRIEEVLFNTSSKNSYELIQNAIETDTSRLAEIPEAADPKFIQPIAQFADSLARNAENRHHRFFAGAELFQLFHVEDFNSVDSVADFKGRAIEDAGKRKPVVREIHMGGNCLPKISGADQNSLVLIL